LTAQAQGILMERYRLTLEQAFAVLHCISSDQNVQIDVVAEHLVCTGALPAPPDGPATATRQVVESE
jgi:AmiR/NasT family two-component response regulator